MIHRNLLFICTALFFSSIAFGAVEDDIQFDRYHRPDEVGRLLTSWSSDYSHLTKLISIGQSASQSELQVLRLAAQPEGGARPDSRPAVFVSANIEGVHLVGTEAALMLIEKLLTGYGVDERITTLLENRTVYVAPLLNPDAAGSYFANPRYERFTNSDPMDGDLDGLVDEDGPDDLNGDGVITLMRVKDPEGLWIPHPEEPRLMRRADSRRGEAGIYEIYTEGLDNDNDGKINEDPVGGIDLSRNFPSMLRYNLATVGQWPASAKETMAVVKFLVDHPNVSLVLNFSWENSIHDLLQTGRAKVSGDRVKVPKNFASVLRLEPDTEYSIEELMKIVKNADITPPGMEVSEEVVAQFFGLDASVSVDKQDRIFLDAIREEYDEELKKAGLNYPEIEGRDVHRGSFVAFCYFRYGVPVFSSDVWTIPEHEGGSEKESEHPDAHILKWSDKTLDGNGFVDWTPLKHPTLGEVEIGGFVPFLKINPPPQEMEATLFFHTDYYIHLMDGLAELRIGETNVAVVEDTLNRVTVHFTNSGLFPTSTAQGRKTLTSWPITVRLKTTKDQMIYSGEPFEVIPFIGAGETRKLEWKVKGERGSRITLTADSPKVGSVKATLELK